MRGIESMYKVNVYSKCIMSWKTFLELFKEDYSLFKYVIGRWYIGDLEIILKHSFLKDGEIILIKDDCIL